MSAWITGCVLTAIGTCVFLAPTTVRGDDTSPFVVDVWEWPLGQPREHVRRTYAPLARATKQWHVCASIPHLKDDYWLAVNFALIQEARRLGVRLDLFEAGGYQHLQKQKQQMSNCVEEGADGLIVGAISADGLNDLINSYADRRIPVVDLINGISSAGVTAQVGADFYDMGRAAGEYLKRLTDNTGAPVRIAWFPGPQGAGWVSAGDQGLRDALKGTRITIVETHFGDTGITEQTRLLNTTLDRHKEIGYVVGTAVTAEAAVRVLRERKLSERVKVISYYFGPGVYRGIQRRTILAAPTDQPALQTRLAVDLMVRILERRSYPRRVSAPVLLIDGDSVNRFDITRSLAPPGFRRIFSTTN